MKNISSIVTVFLLFVSNSFGSAELYEKALKLYNSKKYKEAQGIFEEVSLVNNTKRINFYLGRISYELGEYEKALGYYEKVLFDEPENLRVRLEIAQTYLKLGDKQSAKSEFSYLLEENIPKNIRSYIERVVTSIESNKDYKLDNTLLVGFGYDDNVESSTDIGSYNIYIPQLNQNVAVNGAQKISSTTYEVGLVSEYTKKLSEEFLLKLNLVGLTQNYTKSELSDNELELLSFGITPVLLGKDYKASLRFGYDFIWYGHQSYLRNYTIAPNVSVKLGESLLNSTTFKFSRKAFIQSANNSSGVVVNDKEKDSRTYELSNKLSHYSKEYGITNLELALGKESDLDDVRVDIDKRYGSISLSHIYPFSNKLVFNPMITYKKTKYDNYDSSFQNYRDDKTYRVTLGVNYNITNSLIFSGSYVYLNQSSNFAPYDYEKNIVKTTLNYKF